MSSNAIKISDLLILLQPRGLASQDSMNEVGESWIYSFCILVTRVKIISIVFLEHIAQDKS